MTDEWVNSFEAKLQQIRHENTALHDIWSDYRNGDHYEQLIAQLAGQVYTIIDFVIDAFSILESVLMEIEEQLQGGLSDADIFEAWYRETIRRW